MIAVLEKALRIHHTPRVWRCANCSLFIVTPTPSTLATASRDHTKDCLT